MKKRTEKQPVDDLFTRRLKNMSLPPNPDGFARLQARMGQSQPETRVVFWQNPTVHRYMAVAACLLLTCLFGWLYLSTETPRGSGATVAVNKPVTSVGKEQRYELPKSANEVATTGTNSDRRATVTNSQTTSTSPKPGNAADGRPQTADRQLASVKPTVRRNKRTSLEMPAVLPTEQLVKTEANPSPAGPTTEKQVAAVTEKPAPVAERVLIVTIAEPTALVAARQAIKQPNDEKDAVAVADKSEKDSKVASLWQQVKRVKQGEIFARKDAGEDERGLLGRAYSGLKQTLDKDKTVKQ